MKVHPLVLGPIAGAVIAAAILTVMALDRPDGIGVTAISLAIGASSIGGTIGGYYAWRAVKSATDDADDHSDDVT